MPTRQYFLFLAQADELPDEDADEFLVVGTGFPETAESDDADEFFGETDYLLTFGVVAAGQCEAELAVAEALSLMHLGTELTTTVAASGETSTFAASFSPLSSDIREFTRPLRKLVGRLEDGDVVRVGGAIGFYTGSDEGRNAAERVIRLACLRKRWQFWR